MTSRVPRIVVVVAVGTWVASAMASCYADPINSPPADVTIGAPNPIRRGQESTFTTGAHDPDGDRLTYAWSTGPGPCDVAPPAPGIPSFNPLYQVAVVGDADGKACVELTVTDSHGARAPTVLQTVTIGNQAPVARISVQQPGTNRLGAYDLYSTFRLSGGSSYDPDQDPLTLSWAWASVPNASTVTLDPCAPPSPAGPGTPANLVVCFGPVVVPGLYQVALTASDPLVAGPPAQVALTVSDDRPPCITKTLPPNPAARLVWDPALDKTFAVQGVDDDGDPFPAAGPPPLGSATFSWSLRRNAEPWQAIAGFETLNEVTLPGGNFASGDQVAVRVEARDRQPAHNLLNCGDTDICPADCPQRVTWTVDYQ
jgi:hypothetical protein